MRKRIDWKFITICHSEDELDTFLDANRPTTIAKSHLTNCSLCGTKDAEAHKMRMQYLNCNSRLCGASCEARFLVLSCETAGKIEIYSANEHNQSCNPDQSVEDHLSRKCKKIIENVMIEQSVTKPEQILEILEQKEAEYELAVMPTLTQIRNYVRNKIQNIKNRLSLPACMPHVPVKMESVFNHGSFNEELSDLNDFHSDSDNFCPEEQHCQEPSGDKSKMLTESLLKIEDYLSKLEKGQSRQALFTRNYFDDIEFRLRESRAKIVKEIDKSYQLFFDRINYLKNKYKIEHKKEGESGELSEFRAKKEKLSAKCADVDTDADNLDLLLNEADYISQQLQASLNQIDQNIAAIKRIRYEPNRNLTESDCLLGNLFFDEGTNKKRKLDF